MGHKLMPVSPVNLSGMQWKKFYYKTILTPSKIFTPSRNSSPPRPNIAAELLLSLDKYGRSKPSA